jgi:uncharacterized membrane protein YeaQ/YmgE (transglycosylase-associated protein family)
MISVSAVSEHLHDRRNLTMDFLSSLDFFTGVDVWICAGVGAVVGWLMGRFLMKGGGFGWIFNILIGIVGGIAGGLFFDWINILDLGDLLDPAVAGAIGAAVFLGIGELIHR